MEKDNKINQFFSLPVYVLLFISSAFPLIFAFISQYGFGLHPCELCIYQRIPFSVIIVISLLAFSFRKSSKFVNFGIVLALMAFLISAGLGLYHVGVEQKWWVYGECSANLDMTSIESLKEALFSAPNVRCDDVQFMFLGLSMAGWNVAYSIVASIFFFRKLK